MIASLICIHAEKYEIKVGEFSELVVNDNINVVYDNIADSVGFVRFDIEKKYASYIMVNRSKGKLKIQLDQLAMGLDKLPTVYVYSSYLCKAVNAKDSTLTIRNIAPGAKIEIKQQNNGKIFVSGLEAVDLSISLETGKGLINASGKCDNLSIGNLGTGVVQADEVVAKNVRCSLLGTGTIGCNPKEALHVKGLGSGKVYYLGTPTITKAKLSNVKVISLNKEDDDEEIPEIGSSEE